MDHKAEQRKAMMLSISAAAAIVAVVAIIAIAKPSKSDPEPTIGPVHLSWFQTRKVKKAVKEVLKDPGSAEFGSIYARQTEHDWIDVCGFVSARNSFGGMTGMQPFKTSLWTTIDGTGAVLLSDRRSIAALCRHEDLFGDEMADFLSR